MSFHEVRFPTSLGFGSIGGPERRTEIVTLANGFEERNTPWKHSRRRYDAGLGLRSLDDLQELLAFFEARRGQLFGFRWKDWADFRSGLPSQAVSPFDQPIGAGDGGTTKFQLVKTYRSGEAEYIRPITKPVAGSVVIAVDGAEVPAPEWTVDTATGIVSLAVAPDVGAAISAGFEFDVPVRFDTDSIRASVVTFQAGEVPDVPVVEVRV
ncbi:TIGR02217 family protein [Tropicimonas sp.]|uniref:phage distal tail protein, Rcc01695 family n=1 Tax=Tropicimonas sp. TaxID=2067044 RepID=UPI003A85B572